MKFAIWASVILVSFAGFAESTYPQVRRSCYNTYVAPVVSYSAPVHYQQAVQYYAEPVEVNRDHYYSIDSSYRDKILADSIIGKLQLIEEAKQVKAFKEQQQQQQFQQQFQQQMQLFMQQQQQASVQQQKFTPPNPQRVEFPQPKMPECHPDGGGSPPIKTDVPKLLKATLDNKCLKCHNPTLPERANLADPATTPNEIRWWAHGLVNSGEMPKGGGNLADEEVLAFYEWAKMGSKAVASLRKAR